MGYQIVKLIVHFVNMINDYGRKDLLDSYVKVSKYCLFIKKIIFFLNKLLLKLKYLLYFQYVFNCVEYKLPSVLTAPLYLFVDSNQQDFLNSQKFMQYSSFFFDVIVKSMAQYLINTGRIKV